MNIIFFTLLHLSGFLAFNLSNDNPKDKKENYIVNLKEEDFYINNTTLVVLFYRPNCTRSEKFYPTYIDVSIEINKTNPYIDFAKFDINLSKDMKHDFNIEETPTIIIIKNGQFIHYNLEFEFEPLTKWILLAGRMENQITSIDEISAVLQDKPVALYLGSENEETFGIFNSAKYICLDVEFIHCTLKECFEMFEIHDKENKDSSIFLLKKNEFNEIEQYSFNRPLNLKNLYTFINHHTLPLITNFNVEFIEFINQFENVLMIVIFSEEKTHSTYKKILEKISKIKGRKYFYVIAGIKTEEEKGLADFVDVYEKDLPALRIITIKNNDVFKYQYNKNVLDYDNILAFLNEFEENKIQRYFRSENPIYQEGKLIEVVGSNFEELIINSDSFFVIYFYDGNDIEEHVRRLWVMYDLIEYYENKNKNLQFAIINYLKNDVYGYDIEKDSIGFFGKNKEELEEFEGNFEKNELIAFIDNLLNVEINDNVISEESLKKEEGNIKDKNEEKVVTADEVDNVDEEMKADL